MHTCTQAKMLPIPVHYTTILTGSVLPKLNIFLSAAGSDSHLTPVVVCVPITCTERVHCLSSTVAIACIVSADRQRRALIYNNYYYTKADTLLKLLRTEFAIILTRFLLN